jgi:hypothetical protein
MTVYYLNEILQGKEDQLARGTKLEQEIRGLGLKHYKEFYPNEEVILQQYEALPS